MKKSLAHKIELKTKKNIETTEDDIGRIYHIENNKYYSVTTILGNTGDKSGPEAWRKRVGQDQANRITTQATKTGQEFHDLGEAYLLGKNLPKKGFLPEHLFNKTKPIIDENVTTVYGVETPLWSHIGRIAGRADSILGWNKEIAIFDYKCIKHHNPAFLEDYWIQLTLYAMCLQELYGVSVQRLVLLCANKSNFQVKAFTEKPKNYIEQGVKRIKDFRKKRLEK